MIETPYAPCASRRIKTKQREYSEGCRAWFLAEKRQFLLKNK
jgi:hypothetical protein